MRSLKKEGTQLLAFLSRYWGPMPWLLELAIVLSIVLKHYLEAGIIFALLTINTVIGQIQSRGSQRALEALKKRLAIRARVLRDGNWVTIEAKEIVPGDIISIGLGDIVPADAKLVSGDLSIDQSILTGESLPVDAQQSAIIYSGSIVSRGEAKCVVVNTGANTYFGKTAELVKTARPKSHQEQIMLAIVRYMMFLGIGALVLVAAYAAVIGTGHPVNTDLRRHFPHGGGTCRSAGGDDHSPVSWRYGTGKKRRAGHQARFYRRCGFDRCFVPGQDRNHNSEQALCWRCSTICRIC